MADLKFTKNSSEVMHQLLLDVSNKIKGSSESQLNNLLLNNVLPNIKNTLSENIRTGKIAHADALQFLRDIEEVARNSGTDISIEIEGLMSDDDYSDLDDNNNYHLAYLTPEEIFKKYIADSNTDEALAFFTRLAQAHHLSEDNLSLSKMVFSYAFGIQKHLYFHETINTVDWDSFVSSLIFTNMVDSLDIDPVPSLSLQKEGYNYFSSYLGIPSGYDILNDVEDLESVIDRHNEIIEVILSVFELNEGVKEILLDAQKNFRPDQESADTYHIIQNAIFDGEIPQSKQSLVQHRLGRSKQMLSYLMEEQTMLHNIVQGLITKDANQFFAGVDVYVKNYLLGEQSKADIHSLSLNDIIVLFCSDYFATTQTAKSQLASVFIEFMFAHYDEAIFKQFIERYHVPKNVIIRVTESRTEVEHFLPLIEFALFINNSKVADSLISLGFKLEPFHLKLVDGDKIYHYSYDPFKDMSLLSENHLIYLIEKGLMTSNMLIDYQEFSDDKSSSVTNNVFFFLAYQQYNDAFIRLYTKAKLENPNFTTKALKTYYKTDLLSYYLMFANKQNAYNFDTNILDLFISEGYIPETNHSGPDLIHVLKEYDTESLVDVVQYLAEIFPENLKKAVSINKAKKLTNNSLIPWFDKTKLEQHFKRVEKERDSSNKDYIKHMLSNNNHLRPNLIVEDETFFDTLQTQFPNFDEVIRFYKSQFRLKKLANKIRITPVLLLGEPGIGKTYFAKKLAQSLNTGYTFLDMASVTANWVLTGNNGTWKSAKQGKILESMMNSRTINPILLMDELEKAKQGEHDPTMALYQLLEEVNAKSFTDEFVDFQFDASGIIYIACANTLGNLSEPLQTRFKIINVPKPTEEQLVSIVHNIYSEATADTHIFAEHLKDDVLNFLKKETLRSTKVMIDEAVGMALLEMTVPEMNKFVESGKKIDLEMKHFKSPIKKKSFGFHANSAS